MIEYEYLFYPTRISGYDCSQLTKANMGWMFDIHRRVRTKLKEMLPKALNDLCREMLSNGIDAFNVRTQFITEKKVNGMSKESAFERLLTEAICKLCYGQEFSFRVRASFSSLSIFPIDANGERITNHSRTLTRADEECDSSPPMQEKAQKKVANQTAIPPDSFVFQDLRLSPPEDLDALRLRDKLSKVIRSFSVLEGNTVENHKLLTLATDLHSTFIEFADHQLRPEIDPIERSINERLSNFEPSTLPQKQEFAKAVNAELRSLGLAIRCPKTNRPSILVASSSNHPGIGRFQLEHKHMDGKPKRSYSTAVLKSVSLMPAISSFDIELSLLVSHLRAESTLSPTIS